MSDLRSRLIRLASELPKGSGERTAVLGLVAPRVAATDDEKAVRAAADKIIAMASGDDSIEIKNEDEWFGGYGGSDPNNPYITFRFERKLPGAPSSMRPYFCDVYVRIAKGKPYYIASPYGKKTVTYNMKEAWDTAHSLLYPFGEPKDLDTMASEVLRSFERDFGKVKAKKSGKGVSWSLTGDELRERGMRTDVQTPPSAVSEYKTWRWDTKNGGYRYTADPRIVYRETAMGGAVRGLNDFKKSWVVTMSSTFPKITL